MECTVSDADVWARRLAARGAEDAGTARAHKPSSMDDVNVVMQRNDGSERWSEGVNVRCRVVIDTALGDSDAHAMQVLRALAFASLELTYHGDCRWNQ